MEINIKTLQLTAVEAGVNVEVDTTPPLPGESGNQLSQATVIEMAGDVDANTATLVQQQVLPLALPGSKIILDMTKVPYMSSAGLRMLLSLYRQISTNDGRIVLVGLSEEIRDTMHITGFLDFFTSCETLDSGLKALKG